MISNTNNIIIIGAGLAGCEAAWALANGGNKVKLFEAKPKWFSPAHKSENFAELVCSNSLKSEEEGHATALLKEEMRAMGSLVLEAADKTKVPAGKALAVDRDEFSKHITGKICSHPNIEVIREEVCSVVAAELALPNFSKASFAATTAATIIATGPLTSPSFAESLISLLSGGTGGLLYFYDAIAPIVESDGIDMNIVFRASRYDVGKREEGDYLNCPFTKEEYEAFVEELLKSEKIRPHGFDDIKCFEGCMPIEVMAERHKDALRHGPMKPTGFIDPRTSEMPYAIVQLRQDNLHATLFNIVGFQTRMTYPEQDRVLRMVTGLKNVKFSRYGSMHRNTYINGPTLLDEKLRLKLHQNIYMAGQITGVEGYLESAATGLYVGFTYALKHLDTYALLPTTAIGSLIHHVTHADAKNYQPMKMMWGLFPPLESYPSTSRGPKKDIRKKLLLARARNDFQRWLKP